MRRMCVCAGRRQSGCSVPIGWQLVVHWHGGIRDVDERFFCWFAGNVVPVYFTCRYCRNRFAMYVTQNSLCIPEEFWRINLDIFVAVHYFIDSKSEDAIKLDLSVKTCHTTRCKLLSLALTLRIIEELYCGMSFSHFWLKQLLTLHLSSKKSLKTKRK